MDGREMHAHTKQIYCVVTNFIHRCVTYFLAFSDRTKTLTRITFDIFLFRSSWNAIRNIDGETCYNVEPYH